MSEIKYTIFVAGGVVFMTYNEKDAKLVVDELKKIQELTYGLNGYTFDVELMSRQDTTPNYSSQLGYLNK